MRGRIVPELDHTAMLLECRLHCGALDPSSAAVNEPHFAQPEGRRGIDVFADNGDDVGRSEGVEIELGLNGNAEGLVLGHRRPALQTGCRYSAVTTVLIPPRTEKSPTTVMRRGCSASTRSSRIWLVTFS
jgi:hypothetical protein